MIENKREDYAAEKAPAFIKKRSPVSRRIVELQAEENNLKFLEKYLLKTPKGEIIKKRQIWKSRRDNSHEKKKTTYGNFL